MNDAREIRYPGCWKRWCLFTLVGVLSGLTVQAQPDPASPAQKNVTISVEGGSLKEALNSISQQADFSIVIGPEVEAEINVLLQDVPWEEALEVMLEPYGFGYEFVGNTVVVNKLKNIQLVQQLSFLTTRVFHLNFVDASDLENVVASMLSPRGEISALNVRGQKGWTFESATGAQSGRRQVGGASNLGKLVRENRGRGTGDFKSKTLVVSDVVPVLERVAGIIERLDRQPRQIMIEARFLEIGANRLRDIGLEFGTGVGGATSSEVLPQRTEANGEVYGIGVQQTSSKITPSAFRPKSGGISPTAPFNAGLSMLWQKLSGVQYEVFLHLLQEDGTANLLSAPRILTLNNQEATIIVGTKFPIITSDVSGEIASISTTLEYYENIGIQLNVVPQICADGNISMIVHPSVTDQIGTASARLGAGADTPTTEYPILSTREAETQVLLKSGETLVMGGLLETREGVTELKTPLLGDLPLIGRLFRRTTRYKEKVDLLFFITATIVDPMVDQGWGQAAVESVGQLNLLPTSFGSAETADAAEPAGKPLSFNALNPEDLIVDDGSVSPAPLSLSTNPENSR